MKSGFILVFLWLLAACTTPSNNRVTQVASIDGLLAGVYDGEVTLGELVAYGDFGLGTYQAVDGEMVMLDGIFYQVKSDGSVHVPPPEMLTPFAAVVDFEPDFFAELPSLDQDALQLHLDKLIPDQNQFVAIKIEGHFAKIRTRSPPVQQKPYPVLAEVIKEQAVFDLENVEGTLVGLRCPPFVKGLNVPGYHFHFITSDRNAGGHVLSLELASGTLSADTVHHEFTVILPQKAGRSGDVDLSLGRGNALEAVEK